MLKRNYFQLFGLCLLLMMGSQVGVSQNADTTPQAVMQKMAATYAGASSYQDTGFVADNIKDGRPVETTLTFETYFQRPRQFRFAWIDLSLAAWREKKNAVWSDGQQTYSLYRWESNHPRQSQSISLAISAATGVSRGAAQTVSALLMEDVNGVRLTELSELSLLSRENFEGQDCYVIRGYWNRQPVDLWIGTSDYLIRKVRSRNGDETYKEEIHRNIQLNAKLPPEVFTNP